MNDLLQRWEFASLLNENVDLVLQGHEHAYARMTQWEGGKRIPPIYTVSHCSPKFYRVQFDDRFDVSVQERRFINISPSTATHSR